MFNSIESTYYARPRVIDGCALRTRTGEAKPHDMTSAAELLRKSAGDARFTFDMVERWVNYEVEPSREDYAAMCSILAGFGKVMNLTADVLERVES